MNGPNPKWAMIQIGSARVFGGRHAGVRIPSLTPTTKGEIKKFAMTTTTPFRYEHNEGLDRLRWSARESFRYMYGGGRPWHRVSDFYSHLIHDHHHHRRRHQQQRQQQQDDDDASSSSSSQLLLRLFPPLQEEEQDYDQHDDDDVEAASAAAKVKGSSRWDRLTFKILLSYHGPSFDGWQKQPSLYTVQGLVEKILGRFVDDKKAQQLRDKSLPLEGCAVVAGRTDKGVTALRQVCSFYTWNKCVGCQDIMAAINDAAPGMLRAISVSKVSRVFHPNFSAKWRRYLYIFPLDNGDQGQGEEDIATSVDEDDDDLMEGETEYKGVSVVCNGNEGVNGEMKPRSFRVSKVNELLRQLEGKTLSYKMFARDTKASRSIGPPTECFMFHARAAEAKLPCTNQADTELRVMCVELVANRFLRKMVRVLVATAIREAAVGANDDGLVKLMDASCRRATAPPAPPDGLCLVDVGYRDFEREICFIQ